MSTIKPARKQVNSIMGPSKAVTLNDRPGTFYNIWYNRWSGGDRIPRNSREKATTRCNAELDSGETKGDKMPSTYFCLYFARGCCPFGYECNYWHRVPKGSDPTDSTIDAFGRDKYNEYREDMGGVGTFNRENRTLYVGHVHVGPDMEEIVNKHFSEWGEIEKIKILKDKGVAFVTYKSSLNAEFAKEAMTNQSLDHNEVLNVRWATDDPNPRAKEEYKRKAEALAAQAIQKSLPAEFSLGSYEYFNKRLCTSTNAGDYSGQGFYGLEGYENPYGIVHPSATIVNEKTNEEVSTTTTTVILNKPLQQQPPSVHNSSSSTIIPFSSSSSTTIDNNSNLLGLQQTYPSQSYLKNSIVSAETLESIKTLSRGFNSFANSGQTNKEEDDKKSDRKENNSVFAGLADYGSSDENDGDDNEEEKEEYRKKEETRIIKEKEKETKGNRKGKGGEKKEKVKKEKVKKEKAKPIRRSTRKKN